MGKIKQNQKQILLTVLIVAFAFWIRFYNFSERLTYGPEQAMSLLVASGYINEKLSLLGREYFRVTSTGLKLFTGALSSYTLVPLLVAFNYKVVPITAYFSLLNVLTGLILFFLVKKIFNFPIALFSMGAFLFNRYMIYHSLFIWNLNYLPLIGILIFYVLFLINTCFKTRYLFVLGLLMGIGVNLQFLFIPFALLIFVYLLFKKKLNLGSLLKIVFGGLCGNFTMILFDLRHNFYHSKTLWQYFLDTFSNPSQSGITYYHFLYLWPLAAVLIGVFLYYLWKENKIIALLFIGFYLFLNITSDKISFYHPMGMPDGLNAIEIFEAAGSISEDDPQYFNVVSTLDFDARGHILRYPLEYIYKLEPLGVEEYKEAKTLYVICEKDYDFMNTGLWEINVFEPKKTELLNEIDEKYAIYKLTK